MFSLKLKKIFFITCICFFANLHSSAQKQADFVWVDKHYNTVLEELFPTLKGVGWRIGFRNYGNLENPATEYSAAFSEEFRNGGNKIIVLVKKSDSVSILDQLLAARSSKRRQSINKIKKQLKVKEWNLTEDSCSPIKNLYSEFYSLDLKMLSNKDREEKEKGVATFTLHAVAYDFDATISGGGLSMTLTEENHPFIIWANKTRNVLDKCIQQGIK